MRSCRFTAKPRLNCDFASRQFSSLHMVSGAHVPWMCPPADLCRLLVFSLVVVLELVQDNISQPVTGFDHQGADGPPSQPGNDLAEPFDTV